MGVAAWVLALGLAAWQWGEGPEGCGLRGRWAFQHGGTVRGAEFRADGTAVIGMNRYRYSADTSRTPWRLDLVAEDGHTLFGVFRISGDGNTVDLAYRSASEGRPTDPAYRGMRLMRDWQKARHLAREARRRRALYQRFSG